MTDKDSINPTDQSQISAPLPSSFLQHARYLFGYENLPFVLVSSQASRQNAQVSFLALLETLISIGLYWWVATSWDAHQFLLLSSLFITPLLLLRSKESRALGIQWLDKDLFGFASFKQWPWWRKSMWVIPLVLLGCVATYALFTLLRFDLFGTLSSGWSFGWFAVALGAIVVTGLVAGLGVVAVARTVTRAERRPVVVAGLVTVVAVGLVIVIGVEIWIEIGAKIVDEVMNGKGLRTLTLALTLALALGAVGEVVGAVAGLVVGLVAVAVAVAGAVAGAMAGAVAVTVAVMVAAAVAVSVLEVMMGLETGLMIVLVIGLGVAIAFGAGIGVVVGVVLRVTICRVLATVFRLPQGLHQLPANWLESVAVIDMASDAELMPNIKESKRWSDFSLRGFWFRLKAEKDFFMKVVWVLMGSLFFMPALVYRWYVKSTTWVYWILVVLLRHPKSKEQKAWLTKAWGTGGARINGALSSVGFAVAVGLLFDAKRAVDILPLKLQGQMPAFSLQWLEGKWVLLSAAGASSLWFWSFFGLGLGSAVAMWLSRHFAHVYNNLDGDGCYQPSKLMCRVYGFALNLQTVSVVVLSLLLGLAMVLSYQPQLLSWLPAEQLAWFKAVFVFAN